MSSYTAIEEAGQSLVYLLRDSMGDLVDPDSIALVSPGEVAGENVRVSLFLYHVLENPYTKNQEAEAADSTSEPFPPLVLDLYYMLTSHPSSQIQDRTVRTMDEHMVLGRAMQVLNDSSPLTGSMLQGSLASDGSALSVLLVPASIDDTTKIWTTFQGKPYRPSACYLVTPVRVDSGRPPRGTQRVVSKETDHNRMVPNRREG